MSKPLIIAIDFDGTIVEHQYPDIGSPVPGAFDYMRQFVERGAKLILWTMRHGQELEDAVAFVKDSGIELFGVNCNPNQHTWTDSPKAYAQVYIDDAAFGCPLCESKRMGGRPYVDWDIVGPAILAILEVKDDGRKHPDCSHGTTKKRQKHLGKKPRTARRKS